MHTFTNQHVSLTKDDVREAIVEYLRGHGHDWVKDVHVTVYGNSGALASRKVDSDES